MFAASTRKRKISAKVMISVSSSSEHGGVSVSSTCVPARAGDATQQEQQHKRQERQQSLHQTGNNGAQREGGETNPEKEIDIVRLFAFNGDSNVLNGETLLESKEVAGPSRLLRRTRRSFAKLCRSLETFAGKRFSSTSLIKDACPCSVAGKLVVSIVFDAWLALQLQDATTTRKQHLRTVEAATLALVHAVSTFAAIRSQSKAPMMSIATCVLLAKDIIAVDHALRKVEGVCEKASLKDGGSDGTDGHGGAVGGDNSIAATIIDSIRREMTDALAQILEQLSDCVSCATQNCCATVLSVDTGRFKALVPSSFGETIIALDREWDRGKRGAPTVPPLDDIRANSHLFMAKRILEDVLWVGLNTVLQSGASIPAQASQLMNTAANAVIFGILSFIVSSQFRVNSGGAAILDRNFGLIEAAARERSRAGFEETNAENLPLPALEIWRKCIRPVIEAAPPESCPTSCLPLGLFAPGVGSGGGGGNGGGRGSSRRVVPIGDNREDDAEWVAQFQLLRTSRGN